mgnify:CR=1 FL=1
MHESGEYYTKLFENCRLYETLLGIFAVLSFFYKGLRERSTNQVGVMVVYHHIMIYNYSADFLTEGNFFYMYWDANSIEMC